MGVFIGSASNIPLNELKGDKKKFIREIDGTSGGSGIEVSTGSNLTD